MLQLPGLLLQLISHPGSIVTSVIIFFADEFRPLDVDISKILTDKVGKGVM